MEKYFVIFSEARNTLIQNTDEVVVPISKSSANKPRGIYTNISIVALLVEKMGTNIIVC